MLNKAGANYVVVYKGTRKTWHNTTLGAIIDQYNVGGEDKYRRKEKQFGPILVKIYKL